MHNIATTLTALVALAVGSSASAVRRDPGTYVGAFQTYDVEGCSFMPMCTRKVYGADVVRPRCHSFGDDYVGSVSLTDVGDGCEFFIYTDAACTVGRTKAAVNTCNNADRWKSWGMECAPGHY
ncbi:Protein PBN1 [Purpureocillium lavendulum]|uniref:Protein PBN1 n=1 Tax=Purpureocillium lavendulum TaxID=1247861 RepID=A0AB34G020_9HYPO|nr:Protein PBN1 [Purpureocillium lavendulum]